MTNLAIAANGLRKSYGDKTVLNDGKIAAEGTGVLEDETDGTGP